MARVNFTITDQTHEWVFSPNGQRTGQWTITFMTPDGIESQVIVPDSQYHPRVVAPLIAAQVVAIEAVQHLNEGDPAQGRGGGIVVQ